MNQKVAVCTSRYTDRVCHPLASARHHEKGRQSFLRLLKASEFR